MSEVARARLGAQRLVGRPFSGAAAAVGWLTAVQAQDYAGAKWALGLRTPDATDAALDKLFDAGAFLRTHVLRPTWHLVLPEDIRWLLELTGPRVKAQLAAYDRREGVTQELLAQSRRVLAAELASGTERTRPQLSGALARAGIRVTGLLVGRLLMHAELDGLIASGARQGRQQTYALLDARAPRAPRRPREEAVAELVRRYFTGHGPAQVQDCAWWSGLTMGDVRRGLAEAGSELVEERIDGRAYRRPPNAPQPQVPLHTAHLLPNYDEFVVAYRDRSAALDPARGFDLAPFPMGSILAHTVLLDGQVWGGWKRRRAGREVVVELGPLDVLDAAAEAALERAAEAFGRFLEMPVRLSPGFGPALPARARSRGAGGRRTD